MSQEIYKYIHFTERPILPENTEGVNKTVSRIAYVCVRRNATTHKTYRFCVIVWLPSNVHAGRIENAHIVATRKEAQDIVAHQKLIAERSGQPFVEVYESDFLKMSKGGGIAYLPSTQIELVENPFVKEYGAFGDAKKFIQAIMSSGYVFVDVKYETKTSLYIALHIGSMRFALNSEVKGLKYLVRNETSYDSYESRTAYYLKASSIADIQQHVEENLKPMLPEGALDGIVLKIYNTEPIMALLDNGKLEYGGSVNYGITRPNIMGKDCLVLTTHEFGIIDSLNDWQYCILVEGDIKSTCGFHRSDFVVVGDEVSFGKNGNNEHGIIQSFKENMNAVGILSSTGENVDVDKELVSKFIEHRSFRDVGLVTPSIEFLKAKGMTFYEAPESQNKIGAYWFVVKAGQPTNTGSYLTDVEIMELATQFGLACKTMEAGGDVSDKYCPSEYLTKEQWEKWNNYVETGELNGKKQKNMFTVARSIGTSVAKIKAYVIEQNKKKAKYAAGGQIYSQDKGGQLVFSSATKGGKYIIEVRHETGNTDSYVVYEYTSGDLRGVGSYNTKETVIDRLLDTIIGSKEIDGINYIVNFDSLQIGNKLPKAEKIWHISNSKGYREWMGGLSAEGIESIIQQVNRQGDEQAEKNGWADKASFVSEIFTMRQKLFKNVRLQKYLDEHPDIKKEVGSIIFDSSGRKGAKPVDISINGVAYKTGLWKGTEDEASAIKDSLLAEGYTAVVEKAEGFGFWVYWGDKKLEEGGPVTEKPANTYKAFYKGRSIEVTADSSYGAQKKAAEQFKAKKSYDVTVVLLSIGDKEVIHSTSEFSKGGPVHGETKKDKQIESLNNKYAKKKRFKDSTAAEDLNAYFRTIADTRSEELERKVARKGIISTTGSAKLADEYISKRKALKEYPEGYFEKGGHINSVGDDMVDSMLGADPTVQELESGQFNEEEPEDFVGIEPPTFEKGGSFTKCPVGTQVQTLLFKKEAFTKAQAKKWAKANKFKYGSVETTEHMHRIRQQEPSKFEKTSFRTIHFTDNIEAVIGCPKAKKKR